MKEGLLWFDSNPGRDLDDKIAQAATRHLKKYGTSPDVCYVHPSALSDNASGSKMKKVGGVRVSSLSTVLVHHFWIGVEEKQARTDGVTE